MNKLFGRNKKETAQSDKSKAGPVDIDRLYSICRRLEGRIIKLEDSLSAVRRDVNRIDRRAYPRGKQEVPSIIEREGEENEAKVAARLVLPWP